MIKIFCAIGIVVFTVILCIFFFGCTLNRHDNVSSNELESLSNDVLKRKEGIDIQIRPIESK